VSPAVFSPVSPTVSAMSHFDHPSEVAIL